MEVSIIIPVYNAEKHLRRCIDSIIAQTSREWEIIAIDDASSDGSIDILKEYEKKIGPQMRWYTQENRGVSKTRERGVKLSDAKYVMFVDNDDFLDKDYVETFLREIKAGGYDCVVGGYRRVNAKNKEFYKNTPVTEWQKYAIMMPWGRILRREYIVENDIRFLDYPLGEDLYFNMQLYHKSSKVKRISYIGYNWYLNDESVSRTTHRGLKKICDATYMLDKVDEAAGHSRALALQYWYVKWVVWYLGYSGRNASKEDFLYEADRLFGWLEKNGIRSRFPLISKEIKGEPLLFRIIIIGFLCVKKFHLLKLFAAVYCK